MSDYIRIHGWVSGHVQGVGFRYFVFDVAQEMNIKGHVRNLRSGEVEIEAESDDNNALNVFLEKIKRGPSFARVTEVETTRFENLKGYKEFHISI